MQYRTFFTIQLFLIINTLLAQDTTRLVISDKYQALLFDQYSVDSIWTAVKVVDRQSARELLETQVETIVRDDMQDVYVENFSLDGKSDTQIAAIIYHDLNFDGIPDLAIRRNYEGAYHIYLANNEGGFDYSDSFSQLTNRHRGLYRVNKEQHRIECKMGGYWDWYYEYQVENSQPMLAKMTVKSTLPDPFFYQIERQFADKLVEETQDFFIFDADYLNENNTEFFYSFIDPYTKQQLLLFVYDRQLYISLVAKDSIVEWSLPVPLPQRSQFVLEDSSGSFFNYSVEQEQEITDFELRDDYDSLCLSLKTKQGSLEFCESSTDANIRIIIKGKERLLEPNKKGKTSLSDLSTMKISNLKFD